MSKFNSTATRPAHGQGPIAATGPAVTHEGGSGYARDLKSELFLLAVSNMVGEDTFYESAGDRDERYRTLVRAAAVADPVWTAGLLRWLRADGNMRSASLVGAAEFVKARAEQPSVPASQSPGFLGDNRSLDRLIVDAVCQRADEPGEMLAYWTSQYGRTIPKPVKRGVADAARRLYNERSLLKYDTASKGFRFADVLDLVHPSPVAPWQGALFRHALDRRHGRDTDMDTVVANLPMLLSNSALRMGVAAGKTRLLLSPDALKGAGMTWEDALSLAGPTVDKAALWSALIPSMGIMALARNLRNFDEAGVDDATAALVTARFADPEQVAKSRMFPYRWLAAYENAPSLRWGHALDQALTASVSAVPSLPGRSLVLIDTSGSMTSMGYSAKSKVTPARAAAVFGVVLSMRCGADVYGFADGVFRHDVPKGASALRAIEGFLKRTGEVGHGTDIAGSLRRTWSGHDRVFIVSDMQTMTGNVSTAVPGNVAMYGFNLGGYRAGAVDAGKTNRVELGGLTDATFRMVPLIEASRQATWPWEAKIVTPAA